MVAFDLTLVSPVARLAQAAGELSPSCVADLSRGRAQSDGVAALVRDISLQRHDHAWPWVRFSPMMWLALAAGKGDELGLTLSTHRQRNFKKKMIPNWYAFLQFEGL
jgi:hypothetical protein